MNIVEFLNYKNNPENKIINMNKITNYDKNIKFNKKRYKNKIQNYR